jgi:choline transport protein
LSYIFGWLAVLAWQVGINALAFLVTNQVLGLAVLCNPSYVPQRWHETLVIILVVTLSMLFNSVFAGKLPFTQIIAFMFHVGGFLAVFITLWVMGNSTRPSASDVFFTFTDGGEWGNLGLSCLIGSLTPIFSLSRSSRACKTR